MKALDPKLLETVGKSPIYGIHEGEKVLMFVHKHWIIEYRYYFVLLFSLLLLPATFIFWSFIPFDFRFGALLGVLFIVHYFLIKSFTGWLDFYLDVIIVTDQRIIDIDQQGLFHRKANEISLVKIQNIIAEKNSMFAEWFDYGNIKIMVSGDNDNMGLSNIPKPNEVAAFIRQNQEEYMRSTSLRPDAFV